MNPEQITALIDARVRELVQPQALRAVRALRPLTNDRCLLMNVEDRCLLTDRGGRPAPRVDSITADLRENGAFLTPDMVSADAARALGLAMYEDQLGDHLPRAAWLPLLRSTPRAVAR
jgi:hypothetical protein